MVGKPIPVQKKYRPSEEEVDQVHQKYLNELSALFEKHKAKYNVPEDCHLEFLKTEVPKQEEDFLHQRQKKKCISHPFLLEFITIQALA
ncbi:hypothetical protein IHE44_0005911 [Lamprotornis superbus]|uniref:Uncharacterized protein n=1 Tax=Lamprotornis superbus TaxID=245042 RepID=A0A835NY18_9PASS|nr:hypothetical protein IHE44_0005911 [Lamprotornis superbus]